MMLTFTGKAQMTSPKQDLATFLLARGPHAWIGHAWIGCASAGNRAEDKYPRPASLDADYGEPQGLCTETATNSGVFQRQWTKAMITLDCNSWEADIVTSQLPTVV